MRWHGRWQGVAALFVSLVMAGTETLTKTASAAQTDAQQVPAVVFFGDSITEGGVDPDGYVTRIGEALGPGQARLIGAGISGNRVPDLAARLDRDVLAHQPALVVIYIGINDVWHSLNNRGTPLEEYEQGLRQMVGRIQANGARVLLCTPSVIGEKTDGSNPLDSMLDQYSEASRRVATSTGAHLVDLRRMFQRELGIRNPDQRESGVLTTDGVHLNDAGNQFVCDCLRPELQTLLRGGPVRHVVLLRFRQTATQADINRVRDAFESLGREVPAVSGLESGSDISRENLAQGYTHAWILTFNSPADRDAYLAHPAHQKFVELAMQFVEQPLVVDFLGSR